VLGGAIPLDDETRKSCRSIFNADEDNVSAPASPTPTDVPPTARRRYLGFSASSSSGGGQGTELDLSSEVSLCTQLESVLNLLLKAAATRQQPPHSILCEFLSISASVNGTKPTPKPLTVKTNSGGDESDSESNESDVAQKKKSSKVSKMSKHRVQDSDEEVRSRQLKENSSSKQGENRSSGGSSVSGGGGGGGLPANSSVDSLKSLERASMMPSGVNIPLPPKSEWPDYPILVRCSEDTEMKIGLKNNTSA
jgi:hypothetical protein